MIRNTNEVVTLHDLQVAVLLRRPVTIDYENASGVRSVRTVEPFEIVTDTKHTFFRAMDRHSGTYRSFRFDRLAAYRVASGRARFRIPHPVPRPVEPASEPTAPAVDLDAEWGAWLESQYDPDAPIPYLPTLYALNEEK